MRENQYQAELIRRLRDRFPGCVVVKNDSWVFPGIPDLTVFYGPCWAMLEVKTRADAPCQPNQEYYINQFNEMSFASFIYPENERSVLDALQQSFEARGCTRLPQS